MYNPFSLEGKTILITGASSGIGQATAIECSKLGASCVITGRNEERLQQTFDKLHGSGHLQLMADISDDVGINKLIDGLPLLDGVVLCAGLGMTVPVQYATREKFDKVFNINFFSQTELIRIIYKKKLLKNCSSIVFIASVAGITSYNIGNSVYGASKAAINAFMKFCAAEFASRKIRVNSICPGMIETPLISHGTITEEQHNAFREKYLLKRFGTPQEIAYGAIYLLSDASSWTTGSSIFIDGGGARN
ncbi:MAG: SDR family oxidoreductase [Muribaculaceae bacterium]|nr:SDR family oxidoreductase [Muribaculaceae bacterium]